MSFIVEDGSGKIDANSYVSVAEADAYHLNNGNPSAWADAPSSITIQFYSNPIATQTITLDGVIYTWVSALTATNQVLVGATLADSIRNFVAAVNNTGQAGVWYHGSTPKDSNFTAVAGTDTITLYSKESGSQGDGVAVSSTLVLPNRVVGSVTSGGVDKKEAALKAATTYLDRKYNQRWVERKTHQNQALAWPRSYVSDGSDFPVGADVIPQKVKDACCYMALAAINGDVLMPDQAATDRNIQASSIKVGPIAKSITYSGGGKTAAKRFPAVDAMLAEFLDPSNRIWRA